MENLKYVKLKLQNYLKNKSIPKEAAKNLFKWRTRAANFKANYGSNAACPLCHQEPDTQVHSFECSVVAQKVNVIGSYSDIFGDNISKAVSDTLIKITKLREEMDE